MKRSIPLPGDLIQVAKSEWYALKKDDDWLRVCEQPGWHCDWDPLRNGCDRFEVPGFPIP